MSDTPADDAGEERQRVVRVRGARRARLTPAPGTVVDPPEPSALEGAPPAAQGGSGPNDERLRREVPPHY